MKRRKLILRLSSLGDVVLASAAISAATQDGSTLDWVVSKEFAPLLEGHPKLARVWSFDRKSGLKGWIELCRKLWLESHDEVLDLHRTLRTRLARLLFLFWDLKKLSRNLVARRWRVLSKQRLRSAGYFVFKRLWPKAFRPTPFVVRYARLAGGTGSERPDLSHLLKIPAAVTVPSQPYLCVMPGSLWPGKRWDVRKYFEVLQQLHVIPVVLGTTFDHESDELARLLSESGKSNASGVGKWNLIQVAQVLARSQGYLGNDTGLAHLAEAVGARSVMIFGPTIGDMGFGPWRQESVELGSDLWCRPCGKDGRSCFRFRNRYACLNRIKPEIVIRAWEKNGNPSHVPPTEAERASTHS